MKRQLFSLSLVMAVFFNILSMTATAQMEKGILSDKLSLEWVSEPVFKVPESVCYDPDADILYISNINGNPTDKDGNGFISKLGIDGKLIALEWVKELDAPKGMGIHNGMLYVTDIDRLVQIDIEKGAITRIWPMEGAKFLNDIAIDSRGYVYVSDMMDTKIYRLKDGQFDVWLSDPALTSPNGLWIGGKSLYIGAKKIVKANYRSREWEVVNDQTGSIDGLESTGDGGFLFSDWSGNVYYLSADNTIEKILSTAEMEINAADIEYIPEKKMLFVPTFFDNRVAAYTFN